MASSGVEESKIRHFEKLVTDVLKPDHEEALKQRRLLKSQRQEYFDLSSNLEVLKLQISAEYLALAECRINMCTDLQRTKSSPPPPLETRASIGSDVEMQTIVEETSTILIKTLLGFWAECSLDEADTFIGVQIKYLDKRIHSLDKKIAAIRRTVKITLQALGEMNSKLSLQKKWAMLS